METAVTPIDIARGQHVHTAVIGITGIVAVVMTATSSIIAVQKLLCQ